MKVNIQNVAAIILSFQMMNASTVLADGKKVSQNLTEEVVEAENQKPEQEKTEEGEASGNLEDCEPLNESGNAQDEVEKKNLDECDALIK